MSLSKSSFRLANTTVFVTLTRSTGIVSVSNDRYIHLQSFDHDEPENAVVFYEQLCDTLAALERVVK